MSKNNDSALETSPDNSAFVTSHSAFVAGRSASPSQSSRSSTSGPSVLKSVANIPGAFTLEDDSKKVYQLRNEEKLKDQGAMGSVSSAIWIEGRSEKKVLLKRLYKPVNQNQEKLFSNEGFMSKDYGGDGIVKLYGKGETEEFLFMIMEFYEGQTLDKLIAQGTFQGKIQNTCKLVRDILKALGKLHGSEVVHRDLKPANIIIRQNRKPVILDLGLACQTGLSDVAGLKKIGTPKYAAPEQLQGHFSCASDIYSLGKIFLEMYTGKIDEALVETIPQPYGDFVKKCLSVNPENRYANAEEALDALSSRRPSTTQAEGLDRLSVVERLKIEIAKKIGDDGVLDEQEVQELRSMAGMWNISERDLDVFIKSASNDVRKFRETLIVGYAQQKAGYSKQAVMDRANKLYIDPVVVEVWLEEARIAQGQEDSSSQQKSSSENKKEVVVASDGSGDFEKISDALSQKKCKKIVVKKGIYKEHFVIDRKVVIKGEDGAVIWDDTTNENAVVVIDAKNVVLENLEIRGAEQEFDKEYSYPARPENVDACEWWPKCVYIKKNCRLENLKIAYSAGHGIAFRGKGLNPIIDNCVIEKNSRMGILVRDGALGKILGTKLCDNHLSGMCVSSSKTIVEGCEVSGNYESGIVCTLKPSPTINNCDIYGNILDGVEIKEEANPSVKNCRIYDGKQSGVYVLSKGKGLIEDCDIYGNAYSGVEITEESEPRIKNCKIYDGKQCGVYVHSKGNGIIENCDIYGNIFDGVDISEESNPSIKYCKIYDGKQSGVYVHSKGNGVIEGCFIYGNAFSGVEIKDESEPRIKKCNIQDGIDSQKSENVKIKSCGVSKKKSKKLWIMLLFLEVICVCIILVECRDEILVGFHNGTLVDSRDGQRYRTVIIGHQVWMAENLNYQMTNSYCYDYNSVNCLVYGRLYTWEDAVKACPAGWHLPDNAEWKTLSTGMGGQLAAGRVLKSLTGWRNNGTDDVGFSALPAGRRYSGGWFDKAGEETIFWSNSEYDSYDAYHVSIGNYDWLTLSHYNQSKIGANSVRCVKD